MVDTKTQYHKIKNEVDAAVLAVMESSQFIGGKVVNDFAANLGIYHGSKHVIPCANGTDALQIAMMALNLQPGDEVIIPTPFWVTYSELVKIARGKVVALPSTIESNFKISAQQLKEAITDKTKVFLFSSPCNPSGAVYSKEELASLVEVFNQYPQITIISDEIYE